MTNTERHNGVVGLREHENSTGRAIRARADKTMVRKDQAGGRVGVGFYYYHC
jgi:hypothetical protein